MPEKTKSSMWNDLKSIDSEPTGEFSKLVAAAKLDPKSDFREADLSFMPLNNANISGFDFTNSDMRGTNLRYAKKHNGVILRGTLLDEEDKNWLYSTGLYKSALLERPRDFDMHLVYSYIKDNLPLPRNWIPFVEDIDFMFDNNLLSIQQLAELRWLRTLKLIGTPVKDLSHLKNHKLLAELSLSSPAIVSISKLPVMKSLLNLELRGSMYENTRDPKIELKQAFRDLKFLRKIKNLRCLTVISHHVEDISEIADLQYLEILTLRRASINSLSPLQKLTNLRHVNLVGSKIEDISPLLTLNNLKSVNLMQVDIKDKALLRSLKKHVVLLI